MFLYKIPKLEPGPLKKEILWRMRDIPLNEIEIRYNTYSNGIISGCELFEKNGKIGVQPGIIKYSNRLYFLTEKSSVEYKHTDSWTVLKITFSPQKHHPEYIWFEGSLSLDENTNILPNEIELGRFKLKAGSRLRTNYTSLEDMNTEYDTVNLINVHIAGQYTSTIHPEIMLQFARELYSISPLEHYDFAFCNQILAINGHLGRECIERYICYRNTNTAHKLDNIEVFKSLSNIISLIGGKTIEEKPNLEGIFIY